MASFHLADVSQRVRLLQTRSVAPRITTRGINNGDTFVLLLDEFRQIGRDFDVVVGMSDDQQDVHLVAAVGFRDRRGWLRL